MYMSFGREKESNKRRASETCIVSKYTVELTRMGVRIMWNTTWTW